MEVLRGAAATLRFPGAADDPVSFEDAVVVAVTRHSDGSAIATEASTTEVEDESGTYFTYELAGADAQEVDLLVAVWSDGDSSYTTYTEIVGGQVTSLTAIASRLDEDRTDPELQAARESATRDIESACGVAFRARYEREVLDGTGTKNLLLEQPQLQRVLSISIDDEAIDTDEVMAGGTGVLTRISGVWPRGASNIAVAYVHGFETFPAANLPVRDLAAYLLTPSATDWQQRATSVSNEMGSYSLVTPGLRGAVFPLPSVNAFVERYEYIPVG